ncbi:SOS response-associated peptidase [Thauera sp. CAU 1555]|uniref:Abasic site processing protein n=1 Tax=Thauera sedimentorum TaxID=2767595 RepID=A0ABR9BDB7_9RHOO|nr:SOS response-associated peptidase [Thauera sedimentorum]MBC9073425.1 SOS response-associated peptidase [Thauera sedimentorum]MBD8504344.1 SOS response-associated peptidase [Thauera sedimentorum]
MCGRYALYGPISRIREQFDAKDDEIEFEARYNAAPTQWLPVIRQRPDGERVVHLLRWGLVPSWAKDESIGNRLINARAETVAEKPSFRAAYRKRRCIVPANGFYEWKALTRGKQPYYIHAADDALLGLAGLWEHWSRPGDGKRIDTFTILTTDANTLMQPLHERMPVILAADAYVAWLEPESDPDALQARLAPFADGLLALHPVGKGVGSVRNEGAELIERI